MKRNELKKRINEGFSELGPNIFDEVIKTVKTQEPALSEIKPEEVRKPIAKTRRIIYAMSAGAAFVIICLCLSGVFVKKTDSLYMVLDINPSIQIEMNKSYQVKRIKGLNDDGKNVIKDLKWKKRESIQELMNTLIADVADKTYLRENEGILVTLYTSDNGLYNDLSGKLEECIDSKLKMLGINEVTTAFYQEKKHTDKKGRKVLEAELAENYGLDANQIQQMSVKEIICYCKDNTLLNLNCYETPVKQQESEKSTQKKDKNKIKESSSDKKLKEEKSTDKAEKEISSTEETQESTTVKPPKSKETSRNEKESFKKKEQEETNPVKPASTETTEERTEEQTEEKIEELQPPGTEQVESEDNSENNRFEDYYYILLEDNTIEITGYCGIKEIIEIPSVIAGKEVTRIGAGVFSQNLYIKKVVLPDSVKHIGENAFSKCCNLKRIYLSDNITRIGSYTFYGCINLKRISIPAGVTSIGRYAFCECSSLRRINLPRSLTSIGESAFENCSALKKVYYAGNRRHWKKIDVGSNNECLKKARIFTVKYKFMKLKLSVESKKIEVGKRIPVIVLVTPGNEINNRIKWSSSDTSVATVDDKGVVTAIAEGKVKITAMTEDDTGKRDSICLTVVDSGNVIFN